MHFHIVTIFPKVFKEYLNTSIIGRAIKNKKIKVSFYNPADYLVGKSRLDDRPFGGGPGMVLRVEPFLKAFKKAKGTKKDVAVYILDASGSDFNNKKAKAISKNKNVILICGHYEGIDSRIISITKAKKLSIGKYILTGGEVPAMVVLDSVSRFVDGVLGNKDSIEENRISSPKVYTRPQKIKYKEKIYKVPKILISGDHKKIDEWRGENS